MKCYRLSMLLTLLSLVMACGGGGGTEPQGQGTTTNGGHTGVPMEVSSLLAISVTPESDNALPGERRTQCDGIAVGRRHHHRRVCRQR